MSQNRGLRYAIDESAQHRQCLNVRDRVCFGTAQTLMRTCIHRLTHCTLTSLVVCLCNSIFKCKYIALRTSGAFAIYHHTKPCTQTTELSSIDECGRAKVALDPSRTGAIKDENIPNAPRGCSRYNGRWYFNSHATGELDGASEPVCKATAGQPNNICAHEPCIFISQIFCTHRTLVSRASTHQ